MYSLNSDLVLIVFMAYIGQFCTVGAEARQVPVPSPVEPVPQDRVGHQGMRVQDRRAQLLPRLGCADAVGAPNEDPRLLHKDQL